MHSWNRFVAHLIFLVVILEILRAARQRSSVDEHRSIPPRKLDSVGLQPHFLHRHHEHLEFGDLVGREPRTFADREDVDGALALDVPVLLLSAVKFAGMRMPRRLRDTGRL